MARTQKTGMKPAMHRQLLLWVCGIVTVALTMSRHWVVCTHHDGAAHIEVNHAQGAAHDGDHDTPACDCGHDHGHGDAPHDHDGQPHDSDSGNDPHDSCSHTDLLVEVGPEQQPDSVHVPLWLAFELPNVTAGPRPWQSTAKHLLAPPATG
ncbi:MAG: hypothetical protein ACI85K_000949, partial [Hyphomicrobiaceae bacterium]